jgi:hypothetical protein
VNVDTVVAIADTVWRLVSKTLRFSGSMLINHGDKLFGSSPTLRGNRKVINLAADEHALSIDRPDVQVPFMCRRLETKFVSFKNTKNHSFPEYASLQMAL